MVKIAKFGVEEWMDTYQPKCKYDIAETCCASISVDQLKELSEDKETDILHPGKKLDYGEIRGSSELRNNLARLYSSKVGTPLPADNVIITPGAIAANHLVFYSLIGPGDHVICHYPTYQQLYATPESLGAEVDLWIAEFDKKWIPDIEDLKRLIKSNTKLIVLNNPNNPTGAILPAPLLREIVALAKSKSITIMSDEVYRPIFTGITPLTPDFPPSILSLGYANTITTGSLSKAYSLAGIRTGWIASRSPEIIETIADARHYTTISVSQLDQQVAAFALSQNTVHKLLFRNIELAKTNLEILEKFVIKHDDICEWVKPVAGTTCFVRFHREGKPIDSVTLCKRLAEEVSVGTVPGDYSFGAEFKGFVRIGYVCETQQLKDGLEKVRVWLRKEFDDLEVTV
ncbi:PLP-dependent transferase [Tothia fuscella]|uniref:PLP-dependent transferase n=1 Tax=Tothia fuscella TaxID=1048955 RepID=A0A9P4P4A9_9PEZI|nr:PLP-dependent transferase [Tothia fuscella]